MVRDEEVVLLAAVADASRGEGGGERGILGNELAQLLAARGTRLLGLGRAGGEEGREISRKSERSGGFRVPNGV